MGRCPQDEFNKLLCGFICKRSSFMILDRVLGIWACEIKKTMIDKDWIVLQITSALHKEFLFGFMMMNERCTLHKRRCIINFEQNLHTSYIKLDFIRLLSRIASSFDCTRKPLHFAHSLIELVHAVVKVSNGFIQKSSKFQRTLWKRLADRKIINFYVQ